MRRIDLLAWTMEMNLGARILRGLVCSCTWLYFRGLAAHHFKQGGNSLHRASLGRSSATGLRLSGWGSANFQQSGSTMSEWFGMIELTMPWRATGPGELHESWEFCRLYACFGNIADTTGLLSWSFYFDHPSQMLHTCFHLARTTLANSDAARFRWIMFNHV